MKESTRVLIALAAAVIIGIAVGASGNAALLRAADAIAPLGVLWVNAIRMTVIPLMMSLLIAGIAAAAEVKSVGRIGGRTLLVFFLLLVGTAAVVMPACWAVFRLLPPHGGGAPPLPAGAAEAASDVASNAPQTFSAWVTSLLPPNPIAAAATGAMMPLILFTLLLALAIVRSAPAARATLVGFFQALAEAMLTLVRWIVLLAPLGVFALIVPLAAHAGPALAGAIGFYIVAYSIGCLLVILLLLVVSAVAGRIPLRRLARAALRPLLIAFSSSSSIATLPVLVESVEENLDLPPAITGFVLPLAASSFKIAAPLSWTIGALFVAWFYGVPLRGAGLATIAFAAVLLAFAVPGVPRGAVILLAPLFVAIGLPAEGIGILIAVDAIPDTFATSLNVMGHLAAATIVGRPGAPPASAAGPPAASPAV